jgi:hypothetical protein
MGKEGEVVKGKITGRWRYRIKQHSNILTASPMKEVH